MKERCFKSPETLLPQFQYHTIMLELQKSYKFPNNILLVVGCYPLMLINRYVLHTVCRCVYLYLTRYQAVSCGEDELFSAGAAGGCQNDFACCCSIMSSEDKLLLVHTCRIHSRHDLDLLSRLLIRHNLR